ncbi:tryptophan aminotransferase-related protein 2 [Impatiens glandulifera]|uniref:tryptophan aminotransferase-related protein 2 n=1 Tax=Impatiens glandulifera TaxID=253017 RepID=UPI001FB14DD0|nr:tryptophan aminotransferase-related protein 2 [Impatiens glandulifera]
MADKKKPLSRHVLILSLSLNIGLILRLLYVDENWEAERGIHAAFCMEDNHQQTGGASKLEIYSQVIGKMKSVSSSISPSYDTRMQVENRDRIVNLDHGDPTMYQSFWEQMGDKTTVVINGWNFISYFSDAKNLCWFVEPDFVRAVVRLHKLVGNAITQGRHIVVGTGSSQLYQAAIYALSPNESPDPMSVVSAAPYYSSYPLMTDFLKSGLHKWAGDAQNFSKSGPYIELVTTPNNPDGSTRGAVVNRNEGLLVHDYAYFWPQYTPISFVADEELMLFTVSKSTGHAGTRIGWAVVKDEEVARKMTKYIELNTIGVSKESQIRAAKILNVVADTYDELGNPKEDAFFEHGYRIMTKRWNQLREAVKRNNLFSLPKFSSSFCNFSHRKYEANPAFAWLKCEGDIEDCEKFMREHKILTRGGKHFGFSTKYVRISMLDLDANFDLFTERLSRIRQ